MNDSDCTPKRAGIRPTFVLAAGLVGFAALTLGVTCVEGYDGAEDRETLRGIPEVLVLVDDIPTEVERAGVTKSRIQTDVELHLRKAGIRVFNRGEQRESYQGTGFLFVRLDMLELSTHRGVFAYHLSVELRQPVTLVRDPTILFSLAETWSSGAVGAVSKDMLSKLRGLVSDNVDKFINAYQSVNPASTGSGATSAPPQPTVKQKRR